MMTHTHRYQSRLRWTGSTGSGYEDYERDHRVSVPPATEDLGLSSDAALPGDQDDEELAVVSEIRESADDAPVIEEARDAHHPSGQ